MRFHKVASTGSIDESRTEEYFAHLDMIATRIPTELFQIVRRPKQAYLDRRSFYDSTIVQWHEDLQLIGSKAALRLTIVEAWRKWRFFFEFRDSPEVHHLTGTFGMMLGRISFMEISQDADSRLTFSLIDSLSGETLITCGEFSFRQEPFPQNA